MSLRATYLNWRQQRPVGCVFARYMARNPARFGQRIEEIRIETPTRLARAIAVRVDKFVADPSISAATILLARIDTLKGLLEMALALRAFPKWTVTATMVQAPPPGDLVAVRIVREIPFGEETRPSEALVLGPFDVFPATYRH